MIKNVVFDFNGTLLDDVDLCYDIEDIMLKKCNMKPVSKEFYLDNFCFPVKKYYDLVGFDYSFKSYSELNDIFLDEYLRRVGSEGKLFPESLEVLKDLKENGYRIYILSATETKMLTKQLKELGIAGFFDGIIGCDNVLAKGKIEYGKEYINNNNINPDETIMVGDTIHDYEVAAEIGLKCILFTKGHNSLKKLNEIDCPKVKSFKEIFTYIKNN